MSTLKRGDQPILTELQRSGVGLRFNICAHPVIEDFMKAALGTAEPSIQPVEDFGRGWLPARGASKKDLYVYGIPKELSGVFTVRRDVRYRMDRPGQPILIASDGARPARARLDGGMDMADAGSSSEVLNLSFLRLVGISDPGGVSFHIGGVFSEALVDKLEDHLNAALKEVYQQFMKPIRISIVHQVREAMDDRERVIEVAPPAEEAH